MTIDAPKANTVIAINTSNGVVCKIPSEINLIPCDAGRTSPNIRMGFGRISAGNMIPESMTVGRNRHCPANVSVLCFLTKQASNTPSASEANAIRATPNK